ncbi:hypothetical protein JB92DRAFT_3144316 [Gautieria morchelliformis]|nr:hypothetical protein JB92DRAFT_3144316 [Gautieria morchelliformis]
MYSFIVGLPFILCLYVFESVAAPIPYGFTTVSVITRLQTDHISTVGVSPLSFNQNPSRQHPHDLSNASDDLQPTPNAFFPKYGIALLILFIVVCALSSVLMIITLYSSSARAWISRAPRRVHTRLTGLCQGHKVHEDSHSSHLGKSRHTKRCDLPLDASSANCELSSPYSISPEVKHATYATSSGETVTAIPIAPFSVTVPSPFSSSHERAANLSPAHSPPHSRLLSPPLLDHLQALIFASKRFFQSLTADVPARSSIPQVQAPSMVTVDMPNAHSDLLASSAPTKRTNPDTANVMGMEGDICCQDITSIPPPAVNIMLSKQRCSHPPYDHPITHSSPSVDSRSAFYSLSGEAQLLASAAFHSFIDLGVLATPSDTHSDSVSPLNPSDDVDDVINLTSTRYMHGAQLETIHEESDGQINSFASALSTSLAEDDSPSKFISALLCKSDTALSDTFQNTPTSVHKTDPNTPGKSQPDSESIPLAEDNSSSRAELTHDTFSPPRFFPAARPPPPPFDPSSEPAVQIVSALRSPRKQERRRSVAWLQPVIDWAVDHPQDNRECDLEARGLDDQESMPDMESDAEYAAALHSADAMAAVINSLAAIGQDPTDMGLVTGEAISSSLSNSGFHSTSPSLPFADAETFRSCLHARAVAADSDLIEEKEVEVEVGMFGYKTPEKSPQLGSSGGRGHQTSKELTCNRNSYQDQQHGESIKLALISLLSSSSEANASEMVPRRVYGKSPDNPVSPAQVSQTERKTSRRDSGQEISQSTGRCDDIPGANRESKKGTGGVRARSPTNSRPGIRTPRSVQPDRVYASPSSLAGLSPIEIAKKLSGSTVTSASSTPSPSGHGPVSPSHRPTSVSSLQLCKDKGISDSPSFDCTASIRTSSPWHDPVSPSPSSPTSISSRQRWERDHSASGPTAMLPLNHIAGVLPQLGSSPISPLQKPAAVSGLPPSAPILIEKTNSMEFETA